MRRSAVLLFLSLAALACWPGWRPAIPAPTFAQGKGKAIRRPKTNSIYTPASSTDRHDHGLTGDEKMLLSDLNAAGREGTWSKVQQLFVPSRDCKTPMFTAYMTAAMRCKEFLAGTLMYEKLCDFSLPKELVTYNLAIKLYAKSGQAALASEVAEEAMSEFGLDHTLAAARLVAAAEIGDFKGASDILDEMKDANVTVDNGHVTTALRAIRNARQKTSADAVNLFQKALDLDLEPDVGLCSSFLSSLAEPELKDFQMMDNTVDKFNIQVDSAYAETYFRKLLLLGSGWRSAAEMRLPVQHLPDDRLEAASKALSFFKAKIKLPKFLQTIERVLLEI